MDHVCVGQCNSTIVLNAWTCIFSALECDKAVVQFIVWDYCLSVPVIATKEDTVAAFVVLLIVGNLEVLGLFSSVKVCDAALLRYFY